jgi:hypothetical protein
MRRFTIGFTVVVLVLLFASVAGAVPPDPCEKDINHPLCEDPPSSSTTTTTTTTEPPTEPPTELEACPNQKTIFGSGQTVFECLWKPINNGTEVGRVTISDITGGIKGPPNVFVRDDSPGDICVLMSVDDWGDPPYEAEFDLFYDQVPEGYEAWLGHRYWDFVLEPGMESGTHWCAPQDPVFGHRSDTNGGALHLLVSFNARNGGSLTFTLEPGKSL